MGLGIPADTEARLEEPRAPGPAQPGKEREIAAVRGGDAQIFTQADRKGDIGIVEEFDPVGPDELPVGEQQPDRRGREMREIIPAAGSGDSNVSCGDRRGLNLCSGSREGLVMTIAITRTGLDAAAFRRAAAREKDAAASRRMLALALVLEGRTRTEAAQAAGMDRQTLRDWGEGCPEFCPVDRIQP